MHQRHAPAQSELWGTDQRHAPAQSELWGMRQRHAPIRTVGVMRDAPAPRAHSYCRSYGGRSSATRPIAQSELWGMQQRHAPIRTVGVMGDQAAPRARTVRVMRDQAADLWHPCESARFSLPFFEKGIDICSPRAICLQFACRLRAVCDVLTSNFGPAVWPQIACRLVGIAWISPEPTEHGEYC
jgi:hypothetical protein